MPKTPSRKKASPKNVHAPPAKKPKPLPSSGRERWSLAYEGIIAAAMDAIVAVDEQQVIVLFNEAAEKMFRCPATQALGQPLDKFIPDRFRAAHHQHIQAFGKKGETRRAMGHLGKLSGLRANGEEFPLEASISHASISGKKIFTAFIRDISERQRDDELRSRLAAIVEWSDDAIIGKNLRGIITSWNNAAERLLGYTAAEIIGQPVSLLIPEGRKDEEARILARIKRGEHLKHYETERRRKDGSLIALSLTISPIYSAVGQIIGASKIARDITQRKQTDAALKLFRALVDQSDDAFEVVDPATARFLDVNEKGCKDVGYTREELLARRVFDIDPSVQEADWAPLMQELRRQGSMIIERVHQRRDGTVFPIEINMKMVRLDREYVVVVVRDITEREKARHELKLFRTLVDRSHDAFEVIDPATGRFLDANIKSYADLGYTREEMLQLTVFDISPEMNPELWAKLMEKARREGFYSIEASHLRKDGTSFPIEVNVRWVHLDRDYVVSVVRDITERKQQEANLRESEERFREIAENINEVFWVTNHNGSEILYVSPAYEAIWGRTCASLREHPLQWMEAVHLDDRERVHQAFVSMQVSGTYNEIYRITQPNGAIRWIHDRGSLLRNAAGEVYRIVGVAEDITQHRKLEEQFRQAQKMEAIGTLAGGIAHDFNNILAAVSGYAELCKMKAGDNSPLHDYLEAISHAGMRATALVRQILTFSRQQEQQRRPVRVCEIVDESLKLLRATIPTTIEFVITKDAKVPTVLADPTQLHQILMNLGTNAWHAMRDRPGRLEVKVENFEVDKHFAETRPRLRPGPYVRLSVADTGTGMSEATLSRIFEPFFTTKPKGEGTGLGLAVVHGIMESHDGVITVYSKPGEGTIFHLYFPAQAGQATVSDAPTGPIPQGHGNHILYLDDEEMLARLGQKTLEQLGYKVTMCTQAAEALQWVRQDPQRFDLVITDQTMPGMTGVDFAAQVLKIRPDLPIILTTGYSAYLTTEHVRSLGIRDLLLKPHTIHTLGVAVHQALSGKKPA